MKKKYLILVVIVATVFILSSCNPLIQHKYSSDNVIPIYTKDATIIVYFTAPPNDCGLEDKLVSFLDTAESTIDMAIYGLNEYHDQVVNELIKKKNEGVKVRIVTDNEAIKEYSDDFGKLKNAGIPIVSDASGVYSDSIMHNKFVVVDNRMVWTGSTNFTDNGFIGNYNNSLTIVATEVALLYDKEFSQMFVDKKFKTDKKALSGTFDIDGTKLEVYFGPKDKLMSKIIDEVKTANCSVSFDIFTFTYRELADELILKKSICKGVFDSWQTDSTYSQYDYLKSNGVNVKKDGLYPTDGYPGSGLLHNKVMIIDENTNSDPLVITGSANWTRSVENRNDENLLVIHSKKFSKLYYKNFLKIFNQGVN